MLTDTSRSRYARLRSVPLGASRWTSGYWHDLFQRCYAIMIPCMWRLLECLMDRVIDVIGKVQRADGYIHTPVLIEQRTGASKAATEFQDRLDFETYNMGHLITAACMHFRATGKRSLLDIACRAADYLACFYAIAAPELARNAICPSHYVRADSRRT